MIMCTWGVVIIEAASINARDVVSIVLKGRRSEGKEPSKSTWRITPKDASTLKPLRSHSYLTKFETRGLQASDALVNYERIWI